MNPIVLSAETLYRGVFPQINWDEETGKPSPSIFKDKKGVSVDRDGNRPVNDILLSLRTRLPNIKGVVSIQAGYCIDTLGVLVKSAPEPNNDYHAEIHNNNERALLTDGTAKKLSRECTVVLRIAD